MSTDPAGQPSEDDRSEIGQRAAYEAELSRITSSEMILQTAVSLLNLGGRRLGLAPGAAGERDLEQVRDAIDGVRALLGILERSAGAQELRPLRDALSQLQMAYAREAQAGAQAGAGGDPGAKRQPPAEQQQAPAPAGKPGAGPAESSGRLWVPGS
ncbi:MAG TPA: hypothetical protein VFC30_01340 [Solirubrobacteraceae bacterium]|nr:hypothetical protein [Solirubrobacteraceae bacterium]